MISVVRQKHEEGVEAIKAIALSTVTGIVGDVVDVGNSAYNGDYTSAAIGIGLIFVPEIVEQIGKGAKTVINKALQNGSKVADSKIDDVVISTSEAAGNGVKTGIGATGQVGEDALKALGGASQQGFKTSTGMRWIDQLVNGVANESKVGYTSLTKVVQRQIAKDSELLTTGQVQGVTWNFFTSPVTGKLGPSGPLMKALQDAGFSVLIH